MDEDKNPPEVVKIDPGGQDRKGVYNQADELNVNENAIVFILDLSPMAWVNGIYPFKNDKLLKAYAFMSIQNRCCIIGTHNAGWYVRQSRNHQPIYSKILYEGLIFNNWLPSCFKGEDSQDKHVEATIIHVWNKIIEFITSAASTPPSDPQLTAALSMGLLHLNRLKLSRMGFGRKIVIFDASSSEGYRSQYIGLMNIAFTASKNNITINTCALGQSSKVLEQLCHITNAKYFVLSEIFQGDDDLSRFDESIFQLLIFWFLPSESISNLLSTQMPFEFSNTVVCYCHYKTVEISFLCPCCFAVYCSERDDGGRYRTICFICNSRLTRKIAKQKISSDIDFHN